MSTTFADVSKSSATNYLFFFAQRTIAFQYQRPTPPPLNVVGLPCRALCLLWAWVQEHLVAKEIAAPAEVEELSEDASAKLKGTAAKATADKARLSGSVSSNDATQGETAPPAVVVGGDEDGGDGGGGDGSGGDGGGVGGGVAGDEAATEKKTTNKAHSSVKEDGQGEDKEETFAKKIAPLAEKITEYILDHQDDAAQEDRWRTTMKRDMAKSFREQRAAIAEQREASERSFHAQREESEKSFHAQREESEKQREATDRLDSRFDKQREAIDEVRQLVKDLANANQH